MIATRALSNRFFRGGVVFHVIGLTFALAAAQTTPGVYIEQTTIVYLEGEPAGPGVRTRAWHDGQSMRLEAADAGGGPALVLRLDLDRAWRLDPERQVAVELNTARLRARSQEDAAVAAGLMGGSEEGSVRTTALEGSHTVAGHACRGFGLRGPSVQMRVWVAEDLPVGVEVFADFLEWSGASRSLGGLLAEIRALPGFPLQTRTRVDVLGEVRETVTTVTAIEVGPQPSALFEVPEGWRVEVEAVADPEGGGPE
jgi:hypothetical protein